ncbi:MAG: hypothetical protein IIA02_09305 [Proteobacteria bacterium]|uniref:hypothetical protein n=1 Tax=Aquabacterium sp. TaxID=1872578 RepID=UPI0035C670CC|nr:hypothetical protein [Pseudomonadota bacterium]
MCRSTRHPTARHPHLAAPVRSAASLLLAWGGLMLAQVPQVAHAQMVPRAEHFLHQGQAGASGVTAVRLRWGAASVASDASGHGLALKGAGGDKAAGASAGLSPDALPRWEGRIGAVIDRPVNPLRDNFVLAQPMQAGLRMRSLHVLTDYYVGGGFRATVGLVSGESGQAWWSSGDNGGGLNVSLQHIDSLGSPIGLGSQRGLTLPQANAYIGAGYSTRLGNPQQSEVWRFNADFGLLNVNPNSAGRFSDVLVGDRSLDDALRSLRMRPVFKVSVGYAF